MYLQSHLIAHGSLADSKIVFFFLFAGLIAFEMDSWRNAAYLRIREISAESAESNSYYRIAKRKKSTVVACPAYAEQKFEQQNRKMR